MAPTIAIHKKNASDALPPIRRSSRIAARLAVINTNVERRHHRHRKASPTKCTIKNAIISLNDDCLLAIFSFLSISELFKLRNCSHRLRALADQTAPKQCRRETFCYIYKYRTHEKILQCYGSFMQNVVLERIGEIVRLFTNELGASKTKWKWLGHCTALKILTIRKMRLNYDEFNAKIFEGLENLELHECFAEDKQYESIITACKNLKSFTISKFTFSSTIFDCLAKLENIEQISIRCHTYNCDTRVFAMNVAKFRTLSTLKSLELELNKYHDSVVIIMRLSEIETLEHLVLYVRTIPDGFSQVINELENLKTCQIHFACHKQYSFNAKVFRGALEGFDMTISRDTRDFYIKYYDIKLQRKN